MAPNWSCGVCALCQCSGCRLSCADCYLPRCSLVSLAELRLRGHRVHLHDVLAQPSPCAVKVGITSKQRPSHVA